MATKKITVLVPFEVEYENDNDHKERLNYCLDELAKYHGVIVTSGYYSIVKKKCKLSDLQIIKPK